MSVHDPQLAHRSANGGGGTAMPDVDAGTRRPSMVHKRMQLYLLLIAGDIASIFAGYALPALAWPSAHLGANLWPVLFLAAGMHLAISLQSGTYGTEALAHWRVGIWRAALAISLPSAGMASVALIWQVGPPHFWLYFVAAGASSMVLMAAHRRLISQLIARLMPGGPLDIVVLTDRPEPFQGVRKTLNVRQFENAVRLDCPISLDRLGRAVGGADRVVLAVGDAIREPWVEALKGLGADVHVLLPELASLPVMQIDHHEGQVTACIAKGRLSIKDRALKRLFDLALVIWLGPLLLLAILVVALLIKLDDGGPLFFVQRRIGRGNRFFDLYKFRTMSVHQLDEAGDMSTGRRDSRVTRVGAFLRATSIDELPQLINVLTGSMSVVGPRPHAIGSRAEDQLFWDVDRRYWLRHATKPGLTGLAQVRGLRGATETQEALVARIHSDLEYLSGWTLLKDVRILLATVRVISHPNAF